MRPVRWTHGLAVPSSPAAGWIDRGLVDLTIGIAVAVLVVLAVDEWTPEHLGFAERASILVVAVLTALAVRLWRKGSRKSSDA